MNSFIFENELSSDGNGPQRFLETLPATWIAVAKAVEGGIAGLLLINALGWVRNMKIDVTKFNNGLYPVFDQALPEGPGKKVFLEDFLMSGRLGTGLAIAGIICMFAMLAMIILETVGVIRLRSGSNGANMVRIGHMTERVLTGIAQAAVIMYTLIAAYAMIGAEDLVKLVLGTGTLVVVFLGIVRSYHHDVALAMRTVDSELTNGVPDQTERTALATHAVLFGCICAYLFGACIFYLGFGPQMAEFLQIRIMEITGYRVVIDAVLIFLLYAGLLMEVLKFFSVAYLYKRLVKGMSKQGGNTNGGQGGTGSDL